MNGELILMFLSNGRLLLDFDALIGAFRCDTVGKRQEILKHTHLVKTFPLGNVDENDFVGDLISWYFQSETDF